MKVMDKNKLEENKTRTAETKQWMSFIRASIDAKKEEIRKRLKEIQLSKTNAGK